jgi:hypothetical protein
MYVNIYNILGVKLFYCNIYVMYYYLIIAFRDFLYSNRVRKDASLTRWIAAINDLLPKPPLSLRFILCRQLAFYQCL